MEQTLDPIYVDSIVEGAVLPAKGLADATFQSIREIVASVAGDQ